MRKRLLFLLLTLVMVLGLGLTASAAGNKPILALGSDLSADQRATVLGLLGLGESDLENYEVIYVTNAEEHEYLDSYLSSSVIGTKALSSVLIVPGEEGSGLHVTTYNISYCTIDMYTNALLTAGIEDANVYVAAPSNISGTSALIGAVKGYAKMTNSSVDETALETAVNELVVTGDLGDVLGDSQTASDIIAYVKQQIISADASSDDAIEKIIRDAMAQFNVSLTDDQVAQLVALMKKISGMDLDVNALASQASAIYEKLKGMGLDLEDVDTEQVGNFITRFFSQIMKLINSLLG